MSRLLCPIIEQTKRQIVAKLCGHGGQSTAALSREVGISQPALSKWVREFGSVGDIKEKPTRSPDEWTLVEKQHAVLCYCELSEEERGSYLRKEGLKSGDIE